MNLTNVKTYMKRAYQYSFTLIELIVVIVVLGILTAIVVPNVSSMKEEAEVAAVESNAKNLQTVVDMYRLDNFGDSPSEYIPEFGIPAPLDFRNLYPDYLRNLPETKGYKYWVDYTYKVWYSKADSPTGVSFSEEGNELTWDKEEYAVKYGIYKVEKSTTSKASKSKFVFIKDVEGNSTLMDNEGTYAVSSFDESGFETPPALSEYLGYPEDADYLLPKPTVPKEDAETGDNGAEEDEPMGGGTSPNEGINPLYKDTQPKVAGEIKWIGLAPEMVDGDSTTTSTEFNRKEITWTGDLTRRVVFFDLSNDYGDGAVLTIHDEKGTAMTFYDTNSHLLSEKKVHIREQFGLVFPAGAKSIRIWETSPARAKIYEVAVASDNVLPDPVTNLTLSPQMLSVSLNWTNPTDSDFKNAVIYRDGQVIGTSTNGTFVDKPLHANTVHAYTVESVDTSGNRSRQTVKETKTLPRFVEWFGMEAAGFDFDSSTTTSHPKNQAITWKGDLVGRSVSLDLENRSSDGATVYVRDANGRNLLFQNAETGASITSISVYNRVIMSIVIPEGAVSIHIAESYSSAKVYDIHENEKDVTVPDAVSNLAVQTTPFAATLTWTNPTNVDFAKTAIFRNGTFISFASGTSYTDTPLSPETAYTYQVKAVDAVGNQSSSTTTEAATLTREILWSGLDAGGFDGNPLTNASHPSRGLITWKGDLTGKTVFIDMENKSGDGAKLFFLDAAGSKLPFLNKGTNQIVENLMVYARTTFTVVAPEHAVNISIAETSSSKARVYDIIDLE